MQVPTPTDLTSDLCRKILANAGEIAGASGVYRYPGPDSMYWHLYRLAELQVANPALRLL